MSYRLWCLNTDQWSLDDPRAFSTYSAALTAAEAAQEKSYCEYDVRLVLPSSSGPCTEEPPPAPVYKIVWVNTRGIEDSCFYEDKYKNKAEAEAKCAIANANRCFGDTSHYEVARVGEDGQPVLLTDDIAEDPKADEPISFTLADVVPPTQRSATRNDIKVLDTRIFPVEHAPATPPPDGKRFVTASDVHSVMSQSHEWRIGANRVQVQKGAILINGVETSTLQAEALLQALEGALAAVA